MSDLVDALKDKIHADEMFQQADMMRLYKRITDEHGPSKQLLEFVNFDKNLSTELGLEGFDSFSLTTQHEIFLSKLNPDEVDALGMESLSDFLKKYRRTLLVGSFFFGFTFLPAVAGYIISRSEGTFITYNDFSAKMKKLEAMTGSLDKLISQIPSQNTKEAWDNYKSNVEDKKKAADEIDADDRKEVLIDRGSGWNPTNYVSSGKDLEDLTEKLEKLSKELGQKLSGAESFISSNQTGKKADDARSISSAVSDLEAYLSKIKKLHHTTVSKFEHLSKAFAKK